MNKTKLIESLDKGETLITNALKDLNAKNKNIVKSPELTKKISNYIEENGLSCSIDYVYDKMKDEDGLVASVFNKNISKQNFIRNFVYEYIENHIDTTKCGMIDYLWNQKTFLSNDAVSNINFKFIKNNIPYYCIEIYISNDDLNKEIKYNDIVNFVKTISLSQEKSKEIVILADGSYFKNNRFEYLKENSKFCKIMTFLQFIDFLNRGSSE